MHTIKNFTHEWQIIEEQVRNEAASELNMNNETGGTKFITKKSNKEGKEKVNIPEAAK